MLLLSDGPQPVRGLLGLTVVLARRDLSKDGGVTPQSATGAPEGIGTSASIGFGMSRISHQIWMNFTVR
jgi:hypothetical protein